MATQTALLHENKRRKKSKHRPTSFIQDSKTRKVTFEKREKTLRKMARALSELCNVKTCFICFGQDGLSFWPETREEVEAIIKDYKEPKSHTKNVTDFNPSGLLTDLKRKAEEKISKLERQDIENLSSYFDKEIEHMNDEALLQMLNVVDYKLQLAHARTGQPSAFVPTDLYQQQVNLQAFYNVNVASMLPNCTSMYCYNNLGFCGFPIETNNNFIGCDNVGLNYFGDGFLGNGSLGYTGSDSIGYRDDIGRNDFQEVSSVNSAYLVLENGRSSGENFEMTDIDTLYNILFEGPDND